MVTLKINPRAKKMAAEITPQEAEKSSEKIMRVIRENPTVSAQELANSLQAVATAFKEQQKPELLGWKKIDRKRKVDKHMFVAQVVGKSMEPTIRDGRYCIFRYDQGGSRNGKVVLVESRQVTDPETNQKFTIKRYRSEKEALDGAAPIWHS